MTYSIPTYGIFGDLSSQLGLNSYNKHIAIAILIATIQSPKPLSTEVEPWNPSHPPHHTVWLVMSVRLILNVLLAVSFVWPIYTVSDPNLPQSLGVPQQEPSRGWRVWLLIFALTGPIFSLNLVGHQRIFISSFELLDEVCDESRFEKAVQEGLEELRNCVGDGLFTAYPGEHNWETAHRTLMPAFGPLSIRGMFDGTLFQSEWYRFQLAIGLTERGVNQKWKTSSNSLSLNGHDLGQRTRSM